MLYFEIIAILKSRGEDMIVMSKCLAGYCCRYDGKSKGTEWCKNLIDKEEVILVCPEELGGLSTPRIPSERLGSCVINREGRDVTAAFRKGAEKAVRRLDGRIPDLAILKARSPSCGIGKIYDGTFFKILTAGDGVFAEKIKEMGIPVFSEEQEQEAISCLQKKNISKET